MTLDFLTQLSAGARWLRTLDRASAQARGLTLPRMPEFDPIRLLRLLDDHQVHYVLIGGVAMRFYDDRRLTDDLDICYAHDRDNCARLARVLAEVHAHRVDWPAELPDLLDQSALVLAGSFTLTTDFGRLDLLAEPEGTRGYDELFADAAQVEIAELPVRLASREAMLRMKRAADRPKDRIDVLALEVGLPWQGESQ